MSHASKRIWAIGVGTCGLFFGLSIILFGAPAPAGTGDMIDQLVGFVYAGEQAWGSLITGLATIVAGIVVGAACMLGSDSIGISSDDNGYGGCGDGD